MKIKLIIIMIAAILAINTALAWDAYCDKTQCTIYIKENEWNTSRHYYVAWVSNLQGANELQNETVCVEKLGNDEDLMKIKEKIGCQKVNLNTEKSFPFTLDVPNIPEKSVYEAGYKFTSGSETKQVLFEITYLDDGYDTKTQMWIFIGIVGGIVLLIIAFMIYLKLKQK